MHVAAAIAAVVGFGLAVFAIYTLRDRRVAEAEDQPDAIGPPISASVTKPARECF
jgi:hypothetical protein